jgi:hypothetical protein
MKTKHVVLAGLACVIVSVFIGYTLGNSKEGTQGVEKGSAGLRELEKKIDGLKKELNALELSGKSSIRETRPAAKESTGGGLKVAVLSVRKVFQECKRSADYRKEAVAEQDSVIAELEELSKEIEAEQAELAALR